MILRYTVKAHRGLHQNPVPTRNSLPRNAQLLGSCEIVRPWNHDRMIASKQSVAKRLQLRRVRPNMPRAIQDAFHHPQFRIGQIARKNRRRSRNSRNLMASGNERFHIAQLALRRPQLCQDQIVFPSGNLLILQQKVERVGQHQRQAVNIGVDHSLQPHLQILRRQPLLAPPPPLMADKRNPHLSAQVFELLNFAGKLIPHSRNTCAARTS